MEIKNVNPKIDYPPALVAEAEKIGVTPAKLKSMREYADFLKRTEPRIKQSTVRRKVCEKFKVKLV